MKTYSRKFPAGFATCISWEDYAGKVHTLLCSALITPNWAHTFEFQEFN